MYKVLDVARYVVERYNAKEWPISNLKLQKILYFVQAEFLLEKGEPCFPEVIEAWDFGPVVPVVYHHYKIFGAGNIPGRKKSLTKLDIPESDQDIINGIVDQCADISASALVDLTHKQAPWLNAYKPGCNNVISSNSIREYFEGK